LCLLRAHIECEVSLTGRQVKCPACHNRIVIPSPDKGQPARQRITAAEHAAILAREPNAERRDFYELLWQTGSEESEEGSTHRKVRFSSLTFG